MSNYIIDDFAPLVQGKVVFIGLGDFILSSALLNCCYGVS